MSMLPVGDLMVLVGGGEHKVTVRHNSSGKENVSRRKRGGVAAISIG
jgi:hypothetical protein